MSDIRPVLVARAKPEEATRDVCWEIHGSILQPLPSDTITPTAPYKFDDVFDTDKNNVFVYNKSVDPLVQHSVIGVNGTIFCHGRSGSGKTHTMMGGGGEEGLIQLAANEIFRIRDLHLRQYTIKCDFFQCYMNQVRDLLSEDPKSDLLKRLRHIEDPTQIAIREAEDVRGVLQKGNKNREVKNNKVNTVSSRSHAIFRFYIVSSPNEGATVAEPATKAILTFGSFNNKVLNHVSVTNFPFFFS